MANKIITATLHNLTPIPPGSVYRGNGMFEFSCKKDPETIAKKFAEYDPEQKIYFKDKSLKIALTADAEVAKAEKLGAVERADKNIKDFIVEKTAGDFVVKAVKR